MSNSNYLNIKLSILDNDQVLADEIDRDQQLTMVIVTGTIFYNPES